MPEELRVLLVGDAAVDAFPVQEQLGASAHGRYAVTHASSLAEARTHLAQHHVDVAILDLCLPDAEGLQAYHGLQAASPELPVVILSDGNDAELAVRCVRAGAQECLLEGAVAPMVLEGVLRHAVERSAMQHALLASERRFRGLIEHAADGVSLVDAHGRLIYHSPSYTRILGYDPTDGLGEDWDDRVHPDDRSRVRDVVLGLARGARAHVRYRYHHASGRWVWLDATVSNRLHDPAIDAYVLNYRDVTDDVRASEEHERLLTLERQALQDVESKRHRLQLLVERAPTAMATVYGPDHRFDLVNPYFQRAFGRSAVQGRTFSSTFPELHAQGWTAVLDRVRTHREPFTDKASLLDVLHDGSQRPTALYMDVEFQPLLDADDDVAGVLLHAVDLTNTIRARREAEHLSSELRTAYDRTIEGWGRALDLRDHETAGHSQRVTDMSVRLARHLGVTEEALVPLRRGALLHDIGKMGVPDEILLKPGALTREEFDVIQQHPEHARALLHPIPFLHDALEIPYAHHEKFDGSGYPQGLAGDAIPFAARIFAVIDVFDALTSDRPYRSAWSEEDAVEHVRSERGRHFDPQVVNAFLDLHARDGLLPRGTPYANVGPSASKDAPEVRDDAADC